MHILLLDMDGVLVDPKGYHNALRKTVRLWAETLGFNGVELSQATINRFESVGLTSEWDSASVCVALMLRERWRLEPDFKLPDSVNSGTQTGFVFEVEIWDEFLERLNDRVRKEELFSEVEERLIEGLLREAHIQTIQALMRNTRYIHRSPIHRTQQEFVLGSDQMQTLYGLDPILNSNGTLLSDDKPTFSAETRSRLIEWLDEPGKSAVAFTNRPCTPPDGHFDTPEAEMGLRAVGLDGLPIIGCGTMGWLSQRKGQPLFAYLKPSAVHALTAMLHAAGLSATDSIESAYAVDHGKGNVEHLSKLQGARIDIFEDSTNGLVSALAAGEQLRSSGIEIDLRLHGISDEPSKIAALQNIGATIYKNFDQALCALPGFNCR
ncbi:MAG: hypothetical protein PVF18_11130 [Anaerolineales bacterium]|jgi:hypothetical protein